MPENSNHILDKTQNQLNLCLKAAQMGIWESFVTWNPFKVLDIKWDVDVSRMHGVPTDQNVSLIDWLYQNTLEEDVKLWQVSLHQFFDGPNPFEDHIKFNYRVRWPNGEIHHIEMLGSLDKAYRDGNPFKLHGVAKDVTEDVAQQKMIESQKTRILANSRMAVLADISSGIAHEVNNPLTVIQARAFQLNQMAESGNLDPAKIKSAAESISKTGDKIAKIVKSLRAFAQGKDSEPMDFVDVAELIDETLDFCKVRFYNHGIDIRVGEIPEGLEFQCRLLQIEECLLNVFNNAHDAIAELPEKWILIEAFDKDSHVEIHVTDSGSGIPKDIADKIMLPFFSTKEIGKGMGLGLPTAAEILGKHHGEVFLDPKSPHTKFVVRLPKIQPA